MRRKMLDFTKLILKKTGLVRKFAYSPTSLQKNWKNTGQAFSSPTVRVM